MNPRHFTIIVIVSLLLVACTGELPTPVLPTSTLPVVTDTSTPATSTAMPTLALSETLVPTLTATPTIIMTPTSSIECPSLATPLPLNAELSSCAWDFFNDDKFEEAIIIAERCLDEFEGQALREQQEFTASGNPAPPIGPPASESEKAEVMSRGVLNDVAACFFVKSRSLEKLNLIPEAKETYISTQQFPDARVWDPQGWFWSPAQAATDRLSTLP